MTVDIVPFPQERYAEVLAELLAAHEEFWDGRDLRALHTATWFRQFGGRALLAMDGDVIAGYLCGTVTADRLGYVHLVAVRRGYRGRGIGRDLWATFTAEARHAGAVRLEAVTSPGNSGSIAFHVGLGMTVEEIPDYSGDGRATVLFGRDLENYAEVERELLARNEAPRLADTVNVTALLEGLGNPHRRFGAIHVTGTDGKTTTTRVADSVLRACGVRSGRFTTPHLVEARERFGVDGRIVSQEDFIRLYRKVRPIADRYEPTISPRELTYFEYLVPMACDYFAENGVGAAAIEVGVGGGTDGTNILHAPVCVLASISLDHMDLFGPTIGHIAREKVGIIHPGATVVSAVQPPEAAAVIAERCEAVAAVLLRQDVDFGVTDRRAVDGGQQFSIHTPTAKYEDLFLPLLGAYQAENSAMAVMAVEELMRKQGLGTPSVDQIRAGLATVTSPSRLELVCADPVVYLDLAHNPAGMKALAATVRNDLRLDRVVVVVGFYADRDARLMLEGLRLGVDAIVVMPAYAGWRDTDPHEVGAVAADVFGKENVAVATDGADALEKAVALSAGKGAIVATGLGSMLAVRTQLRETGLLIKGNSMDREHGAG